MVQKVEERAPASSDTATTTESTAAANAVTATPPRTSVTTSVRPDADRAIHSTRAIPAMPATVAPIAVSHTDPETAGQTAAAIAMVATAPSAALAETPMIPGSASGLRSVPWSSAPEMPSPAPTMSVRAMRGARISVTMTLVVSAAPTSRAAAAAAMRMTASSMSTTAVRARREPERYAGCAVPPGLPDWGGVTDPPGPAAAAGVVMPVWMLPG